MLGKVDKVSEKAKFVLWKVHNILGKVDTVKGSRQWFKEIRESR